MVSLLGGGIGRLLPVVAWSPPLLVFCQRGDMTKTSHHKDDSISIHRKVSLDFIKQSGGFAVRVVHGQKGPASKWNPRANDTAKSEMLLRELRQETSNNVGIHIHGSLIDIDIDSDSPMLMAALERLLPPCNHIWGHSSRLRTHRVYQLRDDVFDPSRHQIIYRLKRIEEVKVEMRGGPQERGEYSVLPGSLHPNGELYLWADLNKARLSTSVTTFDTLIKAVRLAGAIAVIAPYWTEGLRNELCMAISGLLYRTYKIAEFLDEEVFSIDKDTAQHFLEVLLDVTEDDTKDKRSRFMTFEATWKKAEVDGEVTGGTRLAMITGDERLTTKLYTLLTDSPDIATIDEFLERFAIWVGPGLIIDMDAAEHGVHKPFMTRQQFCNSFGHKFILTAAKKKLIADLLFHMPSTLRLFGVTFEPEQGRLVDEAEGQKVNQWSGMVIKPEESVRSEQISPFLDYIGHLIAADDEQCSKWVLGWLAHIFQEPAHKTGTALVLVGEPGVGKSFLGEHFLVPIIGSHAVVTGSIDRAMSGFNALFDNRIFVQCDEAISNRQRLVAAKMKALITDPSIIIEPKGVDPFAKPNHMRFLFTSNEIRDAVFLSDGVDDRRYTVLHVSNVKKGIQEYWHQLATWAKQNLGFIHRYLLDYKYDRNFISKPLSTQAKVEMQQHSMPPFDQWLASWLARDHPLSEECHQAWYDAITADEEKNMIDRTDWPKFVNLSALTQDYAHHIKNNSHRSYILNEWQILSELEERKLKPDILPIRIRSKGFDNRDQKFTIRRIRVYPVPTRDQVKAYIARRYGESYSYQEETSKTLVGESFKNEEF